MPGFDNGCLFFEGGIDPRGLDPISNPVVNQMSAGKLLIGSDAAPYVVANTLTAGTGISIANSSGNITINSAGSGLTWIVSTTDTIMQVNHGYGANGLGEIKFTLPVLAKVGDIVSLININAVGSWRIIIPATQSVFINASSWIGAGGDQILNITPSASVTLVCLEENSQWFGISNVGVVA